MKVENYFLRYAFPCAQIILERGELTQEEHEELRNIAINNKEISKERLEKIFFRAFEEIDEVAEEIGKRRWDLETIKEYFLHKHNIIIDQGKGDYKNWPPAMRELSKVLKAKVIGKKDNVLIVEYNGKKRNVLNSFVPEARISDSVMIHYGYAVEKA